MTETALSAGPRDLLLASDHDLVAGARRRDEAAIREIVRRYNRRLFRVARSVVRNDADAEDVVQAGYVHAFTHLDGFRGDAQFATWITRIVLNEAIGRIRRRKPTTGLEQVEIEQGRSAQIIQFPLLQDQPDPETAMSRSEVRDILEQMIDALPQAFRTVLVLRDVEGLSAEETARQLAIPAATVNTRLFRARKMLRSAFEERLHLAFGNLFPFDGDRCVHMADRVIAALVERR